MTNEIQVLREHMSEISLQKLKALKNAHLEKFIAKYIGIFQPESVYVCDDSKDDRANIRARAQEKNEERALATEGHTVHFDGFHDQARDKKNTKYLVPKGVELGERLNTIDKEEGYKEVHEYFTGSMKGKQLYVRFFCLGPVNSAFSLACVQLTDSAYVAHSEDLLYRAGYEEFMRLEGSSDFFRFCHTAGALENNVSRDVDKRRVYIDLEDNIVYSSNTQYAGNTVGLKKLAMRLAINKCKNEGWLTEHMFVMGVKGTGDRTTYFTGAYPSACGKTSTAMLPGESIIGDDIAYIRPRDGKAYAVNVENGIFGIIRDVNPEDDPVIWETLNTPGEVIFSNILVAEDNKPYWLGMGCELPKKGVNFSGEWHEGKTGADGKEIPPAHKNARYTVELERLENCDENLQNPDGVPVGGFIYGGRDSDTSMPVAEAFSFTHGIITMGASLESETTAATLGQEGVRTFNLMSILDFLSYPMGEYIENNLKFGKELDTPPRVFGANYFLRGKDGKFLTGMRDKQIWVKWMELRAHNEVDAIKTPVGFIPLYDDLARLFKNVLGKEYTREQYEVHFTVRIPELLAKIDRIREVYKNEAYMPAAFETELSAQELRLKELQASHGEYVQPSALE